jgi:hypothetical protein
MGSFRLGWDSYLVSVGALVDYSSRLAAEEAENARGNWKMPPLRI